MLNTFMAVAGVLSSCAESPPPPEPEAGNTEAGSTAGTQKARYSDIAHTYHDLLLDSGRNEIKLDKGVIEGS
ncbi:MAG TPA: hypothetical protein VNJ70_21160 [Thermoanaerobaculia bacterium]|nr:hypothetical protein [Thermoanaerobaculia bacterium]